MLLSELFVIFINTTDNLSFKRKWCWCIHCIYSSGAGVYTVYTQGAVKQTLAERTRHGVDVQCYSQIRKTLYSSFFRQYRFGKFVFYCDNEPFVTINFHVSSLLARSHAMKLFNSVHCQSVTD